jgi:hypothetical protein
MHAVVDRKHTGIVNLLVEHDVQLEKHRLCRFKRLPSPFLHVLWRVVKAQV